MIHYSKKFIRWVEYFDGLATVVGERTQAGIEQFHAHQSHGIYPSQPDKFFLKLVNGKQWFDWTVDEIHKSYGTEDWFGWDHYRRTVPEWLWGSIFGWAK